MLEADLCYLLKLRFENSTVHYTCNINKSSVHVNCVIKFLYVMLTTLNLVLLSGIIYLIKVKNFQILYNGMESTRNSVKS